MPTPIPTLTYTRCARLMSFPRPTYLPSPCSARSPNASLPPSRCISDALEPQLLRPYAHAQLFAGIQVWRAVNHVTFVTTREGWARAFWPRLMNRSFFGLLRASLLRPSTPFFGTCFVWQQRGSRRQVSLTRSTAYARPAGAVTASHWRCDCDRSLCAPESRLWAVCREERPTGKCRSTCRSSALQR